MPLPPDNVIWIGRIVDGKRREWATPAEFATLKSPDGDVEMYIDPETGIVRIRSFRLQGEVRVGGVDRTVIVELVPPTQPAAPA
jgi:hypothetical protein